MIRATIVYLFVGIYVLVLTPMAIVWATLFRDTRCFYGLGRSCIRIAGWMAQIKVRISGQEKLKSGKTYVFLSNHQGNCDAPILFHAIPRDLRALIKKELMNLPMLSLVLQQAKFVPIDRTDPNKARASIDLGARLLREGYSFLAFPEGTRSRDGRLGAFKKGAFIMAMKARVPIVPVTIANSSAVQPPGKYSIRPGVVDVILHDPIETADFRMEDRDAVLDLTRAAIASGLPRSSNGIREVSCL
jgi:1-acyl-sn-glycerol-3-phosphate acyltransferase